MNMHEHHLILLMEECAEVAHRASKQLRFGQNEVQPGQVQANHQRLREEILDVLCCIRFLERSGQLDAITADDVDHHFAAKQEKVDRMLALSRRQGRLSANEEVGRK